jgi:hypothetical protein
MKVEKSTGGNFGLSCWVDCALSEVLSFDPSAIFAPPYKERDWIMKPQSKIGVENPRSVFEG